MPVRPATEVTVAFGATLRAERTRAGISQEVLAERAGLHRTYIGDVERGLRNVGLLNIVRLATALEVPAATLISGVDRRFLEP